MNVRRCDSSGRQFVPTVAEFICKRVRNECLSAPRRTVEQNPIGDRQSVSSVFFRITKWGDYLIVQETF